jgi:hypothetical protein
LLRDWSGGRLRRHLRASRIDSCKGYASIPPLDASRSPIVSEFDNAAQEAEYKAWLEAKVRESLADPRPPIPHDEVMAKMHAVIEKAVGRGMAKAKLYAAADGSPLERTD